MKAARFYGVKDVRVEDIPEPVPKEGQVKVKIAWNGICGSDLHAYTEPALANSYGRVDKPNDVTGETLPTTLGHEFAGTIVELGPGVDTDKWSCGTQVVIEPILSCMRSGCLPCTSGSRNVCPSVTFIGIGGWGGGLAEFIAVDVRYLHVLPKGISLEIGACMEPLAVAYHAVKRSGYVRGQTALITGAGPIGLFLLKVLRSIDDTSPIFVSEPAEIRRMFALEHGATQTFNPTQENVPASIRAIVPPGVDVAYDAAGIQQALDASLFSLRPRGTLVNVAIWEKTATININFVLMREINVTGTIGYDRVHEEVLALVAAGKIPNIESLITKRITLDHVVQDGLESLLREKDKHVKILVQPT